MEAWDIASLVLSCVNFILLPPILGKLFFSSHQITYMPADQYEREIAPLTASPEPTEEELGEEEDAPDINAIFQQLQAKADNEAYQERMFPNGKDEDEPLT